MAIAYSYDVWYYECQERRQQHEIQHFLALTLVAIDKLHELQILLFTL